MSDFYILVMEEMFPSIRNRYNLTEPQGQSTGIHPEAHAAIMEPATEQEETQFQEFLKSL